MFARERRSRTIGTDAGGAAADSEGTVASGPVVVLVVADFGHDTDEDFGERIEDFEERIVEVVVVVDNSDY